MSNKTRAILGTVVLICGIIGAVFLVVYVDGAKINALPQEERFALAQVEEAIKLSDGGDLVVYKSGVVKQVCHKSTTQVAMVYLTIGIGGECTTHDFRMLGSLDELRMVARVVSFNAKDYDAELVRWMRAEATRNRRLSQPQ